MAEKISRDQPDVKSPPLVKMGMGPGGPGMMIPKERSKNTGATLRRMWGYLGRQRLGLLAVCLLTALSAGLALIAPYLMGMSIDRYVIPKDYHGLLNTCLLLLVVHAFSALTGWSQQYVMVGVAQNTVQAMRQDLFAKFQILPLQFFDTKTHGELMSRTTNDIENISLTLNQSMTQLISGIFTLVGTVVMMLSLSLWMTLISIITVPAVILLTRKIAQQTRKYYAQQQAYLGEVNGYIQEIISGQKVVKIFHREKRVIEEFNVINKKLLKASVKAQSLSGVMGPIMMFFSNLSYAIIALTGGWLAYRQVITIGLIVSFLYYSKQFSQPINQLANQYNMIQSAIAGAERVFEVLDTESEFDPLLEVQEVPKLTSEVVFKNVSFGYKAGVPVIKNISLTANPGKMIALVGPTGAGKTTIVNLLTRFYDINDGTITIAGVNIKALDKNALRSHLGIVLQDAYLFSDTIRENIRYGRLDATDEEVEHAARVANADSFIRKLSQGYDTLMTAEGNNLSQGQRQLITIARAIMANPAILILDEATSNVDTRTEIHIQEAMHRLMYGRTSFVIAHRLSTIRRADCILVLDGGEIIEQGTHEALMERKGFYHHLFISQFTKLVNEAAV